MSDVARPGARLSRVMSTGGVSYAFGEFELDPISYDLRRLGRRIDVEPKVIEFVACLIHQRPRVVGKEDLRRALWPGVTVGESSLSRCAWAARRALDDHAQRSDIIKTVYGRGYQFVARVEEKSRIAAEEPVVVSSAPAGRVRFVGREREMATLRAAGIGGFSGHGSLVLLAGEAGIGKTRMAEEFASWARERGALVRFGRCREEPGAPAFFPWLEILRADFRARGREEIRSLLGSGAPEIAQLVPELRELLPELPPPPPIDSSQARFRLFQSLIAFWRSAARERPMLLVLDDLHRADEPSLKLLRFFGQEVGDLPVLLLGCFREGALEPASGRAPALAAVMRLPGALRVALTGLSRAEVGACVQEIIGSPASERWIEVLHEQTGGNPFFLGQIVPLLTADDLTRNRGGDAELMPLPRSVRDAITAQVEDLPSSTRRLLRVAAVMGREFSLRTLEAATAKSEAWLRAHLRPSLDAGILVAAPDQPGQLHFAHILVRDVLYETLRPRWRARWHRRIGETLERTREGVPESYLSELAHHFVQAAEQGDLRRAIVYAKRAGRWAAEQLAWEEAAEHYGRALELLGRSTRVANHERLELLLAMGEAELRAERLATATETCRRAADLARRSGAREHLARAALLLAPGFYIYAGQADEEIVAELLREAVTALARTSSQLRVRVLARLAMGSWRDPREQKALSQRALAVAKRVGDPATLAFAEGAALIAPWDPDDWKKRKAGLPVAAQRTELVGDRELSLVLRDLYIAALLEDGDVESADREIEIFARKAEELRSPRALAFAANHEATRALMEGRFEEAEHLSREYLARASRIEDWGGVAAFALKLMLLLWQRGREGEVLGLVDLVRALSARNPRDPHWKCILALAMVALDRRDEVREVFEGLSSRRFAQIQRAWHWIPGLVTLGDV